MATTQDPVTIRVSFPLRALAAFLDIGLLSGLGVALVSGIDLLMNALFDGQGLSLDSGLVALPLCMLYYLYFASEVALGRSMGKQLMGFEVRQESGLKAKSDKLFRRFAIRHGWAILYLIAYLFDLGALNAVAQLWLGFIFLAAFTSFGEERLALYDRWTKLAVYPSRTPNAELSTLSRGQDDAELARIAADQVKQLGTSQAVRERARSTLQPNHFPCVVELMVYLKGAENPEQLLFECFSQFVPNIHPDQFKENQGRGSYQKCRALIRFDNALQMETSYAALSKLPYVITTTTKDSVRVAPSK